MKTNRIVSWVLSLILLTEALLCVGCSSPGNDPHKTLTIYMQNYSSSKLEGLALVNQELDRYIYEKLGFHVKLEMPSNYEQALNDDLLAGKQIDVAFCPTLRTVQSLQHAELISPLDELLENFGQEITNAVNAAYFTPAEVQNTLYAVPTNRERHQIVGFEYNRELAEQYGIDLSDVHHLMDLTSVFQCLREKDAEIYPIVIVPTFLRLDGIDILGDGYGVLTTESGTTVENLYETQAFSDFIALLHDWQEKGYMLDYTAQGGSILYYLRAGNVFGSLTIGKVGFDVQESRLCGKSIGFLPLGEVYCPTDTQERAWYTIPSTTADPKTAMRLLNLLYTDSYAANLILYGIEGTHYTFTDKDRCFVRSIAQDRGLSYVGPPGFAYCNQYISALPEGYERDIWAQTEEVSQNAEKSPALGFLFDSTPVAEEIYHCDQVKAQYLDMLYAGIGDPVKDLNDFCMALRRAGIEDIIAEKQRQLDSYLQRGSAQ